jgi:hypothetical protein
MPFSGGIFTGVAGSTNAAAGQVIQSAVWDAINTDYASALTTLMQNNVNNIDDFKNILTPNSSLNIWQRGTSFSVPASTTQYTADRWYITTGANQACTVAGATDLVTGSTANHAAKITRNSGQTGVTPITFGYPLDSDEVYRLRGSVMSFSALVKTGANWSPATGTLSVIFAVGTGSPAKRGAGFTTETVVFSSNASFAVSSATIRISGTSTVTVPTTATQGEIQFVWTPTGTAGADDSITFDDVFLNEGTFVLSNNDVPFEICIDMCKRHYRKTFPYATVPAQGGSAVSALTCISAAAASVGVYWQWTDVAMRATAAITTYNPTTLTANWANITTGSSLTVTVDSANAGPKGVFIYSIPATNANNLIYIHAAADASI